MNLATTMNDLADEYGFRDIPDVEAVIEAPSLPAIVSAADFAAVEVPPPAELIWGVLHAGSKLVLGGGSKTFKTWTLLDLAIAVAEGEPWLGFKTTRGRVLYVNLEIQPGFFRQRLLSIVAAKGVTLRPDGLDIWNLRGHGAGFDVVIPQIIAQVGAKYTLVILDPIYKIYGERTDENKAGDVARLLHSMDDLTTQTGAAVAFGAHYSKGNQAGKEAIDRISGSGVFARDPDSILNFTRHEEDDAFTVEMTLRNFKPVEPFVVRWSYPLMRLDEALDPARLKQVKGRPKKYSVESIVGCLKGHKFSTNAWQKHSSSEIGVPRTQFYELLRDARQLPEVHQTRKGVWFYECPQQPETQS